MNKETAALGRQVLSKLDGLRDLEPAAFEEVLRKVRPEQLPAGRQLFARGQRDNWVFYLLRGNLTLEWLGGRRDELVGGEESANGPLAEGDPRPASAIATSPIIYIRIDRDLLEVLQGDVADDDYGVKEIRGGSIHVENRLLHQLYHEYMADTLKLPHLPDIALKVRSEVENPESDAVVIARIIQADPVLAAKIIQVANSPLYSPRNPIYSLRNAVIYLGLETTRNMVFTYTLRQLFKSKSVLLRQRMTELWSHLTMVSAVAYVLAEQTPNLDPDRAMLAGLLHDIGILPIISYADNYQELSSDPQQLDEAIRNLRTQMSAMVLRRWKFGDEMVNVAMESENWDRDPQRFPDYADIIVVAQLIQADTTRLWNEPPNPEESVAYHKVARGQLNPEWAAELLQRARKEVAEVLTLLH